METKIIVNISFSMMNLYIELVLSGQSIQGTAQKITIIIRYNVRVNREAIKII